MAPIEITQEFVTKLVNQPIKSFQVCEGSQQGDNVAGDLKSITVVTTNGEKISLVNKTFPDDPIMKNDCVESGVFRIENTFYSTILPMLNSLLKSKNINEPAIPTPKYYGGLNDDENDYICMEDLRPSGYKMPDKHKGLNFLETCLILKKLARFHASTYFLLRFEGEKVLDPFPHIQKPKGRESPEELEEWSGITNGVIETAVEVMRTRDQELAKRIQNIFQAQPASHVASQTMAATDKIFFPCIIHGDIWLNNTLIKYDDDSIPVDVKFIDFQQVCRGNIFEDLQYFMFTSVTPDFRKKFLSASLHIYFDAFTNALNELTCPVPINFSRGFLIDNFERCMLPAYIYMGYALPLQFGFVPPSQSKYDDDETPPKNQPSEEPPANSKKDMSLAAGRAQETVKELEGMLKNCPEAIDRLENLTREMAIRGHL